MLGRRFLQINGTAIPNPVPGSFSYDFTPDEVIELSEAGTELGSVRRLNKRVFKGDWQVTSYWLEVLRGFCELRTVTLRYQGQDYTVRARGFNPQLANNAEYVEGTEGLWTLNLTFTEI